MIQVLITGGNGYIARNLKPLLKKNGYRVISPSHDELDLLNREQLINYIHTNKFDVVIHAAIKGGKRNVPDTFEEVYVKNILMYENLVSAIDGKNIELFLFGSGAEFDRRISINECSENKIYERWPIDPYGLSKKIITLRGLDRFPGSFTSSRTHILRLFGCFNHDEDSVRFIKASISNIKAGLPITIHQNKKMDFFYLDDIVSVINYILYHNNRPQDINLVYKNKIDLYTIATMICKYMGVEKNIIINNPTLGLSYTGAGDILSNLKISNEFIGLEEGIKITCNHLK